MSDLIQMSGISKTYDGKQYILKELDFSLKRGEIASIYGPSGSGKTTFLNIVGLLDTFSSGKYYFSEKPIVYNKLNSYYLLRASDIGFVFQSYGLIEQLSVKENILMPFLYSNGKIDRSVQNRLNEMLSSFNILDKKNQKVSLLSGGERQRVAIVRALIKEPKLIIADEPTGNLDENNASIVVEALNRAVKDGTSIIIVTHNKQLRFENEVMYTLEGGRLIKC